MDYKRVLAFGDMHGHFSKFMTLYERVGVTDEDFAIFLGDYIDRGTENVKALKWIMSEARKPNVIALRGNHEQMMFDSIMHNDLNWYFNGGLKTLMEIRAEVKLRPEFITDAITFIRERPLYHRMTIDGREYVFCHAGVDAHEDHDPSVEAQDEMKLLWVREDFYNYYEGSATYVVGHTPVQYLDVEPPYPIKVGGRNIWMIDTGSYFDGGKISCLDVKSERIWQSD
ncbi:MAG: metallophosphoesterase [Selenomonadaceae bacterium]|nr:metallophosphoesterase [Selenomonadaceae bacterium]